MTSWPAPRKKKNCLAPRARTPPRAFFLALIDYMDVRARVPLRRGPRFVMRFVPDYAQSDERCARPRFIIVCDPGQCGQIPANASEPLRFVTFDASLLQHKSGTEAAGDGVGPLLEVAGHDTPFTYDELIEKLGVLAEHAHLGAGAAAFSRKVLEYLFRDINDGGCPTNWELLSYIYVDQDRFEDVFEDDDLALVPVFMDTLALTVQFLRDSFQGSQTSYREISLIEAYKSATAANLPSLSVTHVEADVAGLRGDCFKQFYHYAQYFDGKGGANGEGSFRYLLTTATAAGGISSTLNSSSATSSRATSSFANPLRADARYDRAAAVAAAVLDRSRSRSPILGNEELNP